MTRDELKPLAKVYFQNPLCSVIYGTEDRHFFNDELLAKRHANQEKVLYYSYTREDFAKKKKSESVKPEKVETKKAEVPKENKPDVKPSVKKGK